MYVFVCVGIDVFICIPEGGWVCLCVYVCLCVWRGGGCVCLCVYSFVALGLEPETLMVPNQCSIIKLYPGFLSLFSLFLILFVKRNLSFYYAFPSQGLGIELNPLSVPGHCCTTVCTLDPYSSKFNRTIAKLKGEFGV